VHVGSELVEDEAMQMLNLHPEDKSGPWHRFSLDLTHVRPALIIIFDSLLTITARCRESNSNFLTHTRTQTP
jgi:hypothetical protein